MSARLLVPTIPLRERFALDHIRRALELAERGRGRVSPNPLVGCVVVSATGEVVGEGWHERAGGPHAEVSALLAAGEAARGGTVYVTLEPCDHFGRTPPCSQALIASGVAKVVACIEDPNPLVKGSGFSTLRAAGIAVEVGAHGDDAARQNEAFLKQTVRGLPFVTLKMAVTLDGRIAAGRASSTWVTSEDSRRRVQQMRSRSDAILVGAGTALADDPHLTVRDPSYRGEPPLRVVVDSSGRVSATGHLFDGEAPTLVATTERSGGSMRSAWSRAGAEVIVVEEDREGRVDIAPLLEALGKRDVQSLLVEGGAEIAWSFVRSGSLDRLVLFFAPKLLGEANSAPMLAGGGYPSLVDAREVVITSVERVGPDLMVEADVHGDS